MFNIYKLPIWNEITLELEDVDKIKKAQLIPLNPFKIFLLIQKQQGLSQIFLLHSTLYRFKEIEFPHQGLEVVAGVSDNHDNIYFFALNTSPFSDFRYIIYCLSKDSETLVKLNTCGIAPKERKHLNCCYYNESLYVFGSPSKFHNDMSEQMIYRLNLKDEGWSSTESFKDNAEDIKKQTKFFLKSNYSTSGPKAYFFMEYTNNKTLNQENNEFLENYELCSFDFTKSTIEHYNIPSQDEIFPLKRNHFFLFNYIGQLLFFDNENFHRYDFTKKELKKINRGVVLNPKTAWDLMDFAFLNRNLYMLAREENEIKLYFIEETELNEMKLGEENLSLHGYFNKPAYSDVLFKFEKSELYCNKSLLAKFSKKFKKIFTESDIKIIKISDVNYSTFYILIEQFYHLFKKELKYDFSILQELLILSNKFYIEILQKKCEDAIEITENNISSLLEFIKIIQTFNLTQRCVDYFMANYIKLLENKKVHLNDLTVLFDNISKALCSHKGNRLQVIGELKDVIVLKDDDKYKEFTKFSKYVQIKGVTKEGNVTMEICEICNKILDFDINNLQSQP